MINKMLSLAVFLCMFFPGSRVFSFNGIPPSGADAETPGTESGQFDFEPDFQLKLYGDHFFQYHFPLVSRENDYETLIKAPKFFNTLGLKIETNDVEIVSEWEFRGVPDKNGDWEAASEIRIKENYIRWNLETFNLAFGFQNYSWGVADEINPTDNVNPSNYEMGFNIEDLPVLSVSTSYYPTSRLKFQAIYVPCEQDDKYFFDFRNEVPANLFRKISFSDYDFTSQQPVVSVTQETNQVSYKPLEFGPESGIFGIKTDIFSPWVDFSLSYVYDIDPFYSPEITLAKYTPGLTSELRSKIEQRLPSDEAEALISRLAGQDAWCLASVKLKRRRMHRLGFDIKTILGDYSLWLEACYSITEDDNNRSYKIRNHDLSCTAGFDFYFGPNDRFYANIQYTGQWLPRFDNDFYNDYPGGEPVSDQISSRLYMQKYYYRALTDPLGLHTQAILHGLMTQVRFSFFNGTLQPEINSYFTLPSGYDKNQKKRYGSLMLTPEVDYAPGGSLHIKAGVNLAWGWYKRAGENTVHADDRSDLIGYLYPYNNIWFKISYKWEHLFKGD
jgi:hypothetical protein